MKSYTTSILLTLHGDLSLLLRNKHQRETHRYPLTRRASIKDILESLNIPHTEIGQIQSGTTFLDFSFVPDGGEHFHIHPFDGKTLLQLPSTLWPLTWKFDKFIADINVLKLMRNMRLAGFDTMKIIPGSLKEKGEYATERRRVILTRDRELLKCSNVQFGQLLRSEDHLQQLQEVLERFSLKDKLTPFSKCLRCNGELHSVEKEKILDRLEPLTRKYYTSFKQCSHCYQIYWRGTHCSRMEELLSQASDSITTPT